MAKLFSCPKNENARIHARLSVPGEASESGETSNSNVGDGSFQRFTTEKMPNPSHASIYKVGSDEIAGGVICFRKPALLEVSSCQRLLQREST
jgi:hypothetical protein